MVLTLIAIWVLDQDEIDTPDAPNNIDQLYEDDDLRNTADCGGCGELVETG